MVSRKPPTEGPISNTPGRSWPPASPWIDWRHAPPGWKRPPWLSKDERLPPKARAKWSPFIAILCIYNPIIAFVLAFFPEFWVWLLTHFAFTPARYSLDGVDGWSAWVAPVSYQFLHGIWPHVMIMTAFLAAVGPVIERIVGSWRTLLLFLVAGTVGALLHFALFPTSDVPAVGASGSISGLFGALLWMLANRNRRVPRNRFLWVTTLSWIGFSLVITFVDLPGLAAGQAGLLARLGGGEVAWPTHAGGLVVGVVIMAWWTRPGGPFSARR